VSLDQRGPETLPTIPFAADVRYKFLDKKNAEGGTGKIIEMTGTAVLFTTDRVLPVGCRMELSISWPAPAGITSTLRLVVHGTIVSFDDGKAAMDIQKYGL
jgi:hypothetical protein